MVRSRGFWVRGVSEVVVALILILIAVVAAFGIKAWLDSTMAKMPTTEVAIARYSSAVAGNNLVLYLTVQNLLPRDLRLEGVDITLTDGSRVAGVATATNSLGTITGAGGVTAVLNPALSVIIPGKSEVMIYFTVNRPSSLPAAIHVRVTDAATGTTQVIKASGG
jgi:flagellin-like protein